MGTPSCRQPRIPSCLSIPSSFESSSGVRWFGIGAVLLSLVWPRKNPPCHGGQAGSVEASLVGLGGGHKGRPPPGNLLPPRVGVRGADCYPDPGPAPSAR